VLDGSQKLLFNYCASIVALGDGKGHFTVKPLPVRVQLSSVNAVLPTDINGDGKQDLVVGGNLFTFPPQFGRLDASYGQVLLGNGKGAFEPVDQKRSGLNLKGEIKDIQQIKGKTQQWLLITQNNEQPVLVKIK
jgi:hypothetical protein